MPSLYVTEASATVRISGKSLLVTAQVDPDGREGPLPEHRETRLEVEPHRLELVALVGRVHITAEALRLCQDHGVTVAWFAWNGEFLGRMVPPLARSADLRLAQYRAWADEAGRLERARRVVAAKLKNALQVLEDFRGNHPDNKTLSGAMDDLRALRQGVDACSSVESLLGLEGATAKAYFAGYASAFRGDISFPGRRRHPPPDPANSLLSFCYVLLGNLLGGMLEARGLDPCIGFYHELRSGRQSLALDLLEELRHPLVDRFVLRSCNLRIFKPEMFEPDPDREGGVLLARETKKLFFREWEKCLLRPLADEGKGGEEKLAVRELLRRQVDRMAADLRGKEAYEPFLYGG